MKKYKFSQVRKTVVGVVGFGVTVATTTLAVGPELIPVGWLPWINISIAVASAYGIFAVRNAPLDSPEA
jgi:hypothetical protein